MLNKGLIMSLAMICEVNNGGKGVSCMQYNTSQNNLYFSAGFSSANVLLLNALIEVCVISEVNFEVKFTQMGAVNFSVNI